jgi:small-conductance mechanosensitive channel
MQLHSQKKKVQSMNFHQMKKNNGAVQFAIITQLILSIAEAASLSKIGHNVIYGAIFGGLGFLCAWGGFFTLKSAIKAREDGEDVMEKAMYMIWGVLLLVAIFSGYIGSNITLQEKIPQLEHLTTIFPYFMMSMWIGLHLMSSAILFHYHKVESQKSKEASENSTANNIMDAIQASNSILVEKIDNDKINNNVMLEKVTQWLEQTTDKLNKNIADVADKIDKKEAEEFEEQETIASKNQKKTKKGRGEQALNV